MKVDNTSFVPFNEKRDSVRISTEATWGIGTVWAIDVWHAPFGVSRVFSSIIPRSEADMGGVLQSARFGQRCGRFPRIRVGQLEGMWFFFLIWLLVDSRGTERLIFSKV